jgi:hypothetical protein
MTMNKTLQRGREVRFWDENDELCAGRILGYGQADDGTGRYGYHIVTDGEPGTVYWRPANEISVGAGAVTRA